MESAHHELKNVAKTLSSGQATQTSMTEIRYNRKAENIQQKNLCKTFVPEMTYRKVPVENMLSDMKKITDIHLSRLTVVRI